MQFSENVGNGSRNRFTLWSCSCVPLLIAFFFTKDSSSKLGGGLQCPHAFSISIILLLKDWGPVKCKKELVIEWSKDSEWWQVFLYLILQWDGYLHSPNICRLIKDSKLEAPVCVLMIYPFIYTCHLQHLMWMKDDCGIASFCLTFLCNDYYTLWRV